MDKLHLTIWNIRGLNTKEDELCKELRERKLNMLLMKQKGIIEARKTWTGTL